MHCKSHRKAPLKKDGKQKLWVGKSKKQREKLESDHGDAVWTGRSNTKLKGCSKQAHPINFLCETIDVHWLRLCKRFGMDKHGPAPVNAWCDTRHDPDHQLFDGTVALMTSSLPYWFHRDRCCAPLEFFAHLGWEPDSINIDDLNEAVPGWPQEQGNRRKRAMQEDNGPNKKSRTRKGTPGRKVVDLAANGMCLASLSVAIYISLLSIGDDDNIFENGPNFDFDFGSLDIQDVQVDENVNGHELRARLRNRDGLMSRSSEHEQDEDEISDLVEEGTEQSDEMD